MQHVISPVNAQLPREYPQKIRAVEPYLQHFTQALSDEIAAARKDGGQKTYLNDGRFLGRRDDLYIFSFTADTELRFPDDTPVDLEYQGKRHSGLLVSVDGFDVIVALRGRIGESVATAILYTEPWFLLQALQDRIAALRTSQDANAALVTSLLSSTAQAQPPDKQRAFALLRPLRARRSGVHNVNEDQFNAVGHVLANQVSFIWGPPGTGKTTTLGLTVAALVEAGESVLIVAHSNVAVDVAMLSVARNLQQTPIYDDGKVLRYGVPALSDLSNFPQLHVRGVAKQQNPSLIAQIEELERQGRALVKQARDEGLTSQQKQDLQDRIVLIKQALQPLYTELRQKERELVGQANVVGCTFSKATIAPEIFERQFDAILIDEASMAYIPHCAFVASRAMRRVVIFGDFRQLAPIAHAETEPVQRRLLRDIFAQAGITERVNRGQMDPRLVMLTTQHRMHPKIADVINVHFYGRRLCNGPTVEEQAAPVVRSEPVPGQPLIFYDLSFLKTGCFTEPQSYSRFNLISALVAVHQAQCAIKSGASSVGIVTPYNAQARLIHRLAKDLDLPDERTKVATVHRFQGSENDLIIFDAVDGEPQSKPGLLLSGGMDSTAMRLVNVAISRARGKFIGLFNRDYLRTHLALTDILRTVMDDLAKRSHVQAVSWPWIHIFTQNVCVGT